MKNCQYFPVAIGCMDKSFSLINALNYAQGVKMNEYFDKSSSLCPRALDFAYFDGKQRIRVLLLIRPLDNFKSVNDF